MKHYENIYCNRTNETACVRQAVSKGAFRLGSVHEQGDEDDHWNRYTEEKQQK
jgi:hypothetical protein